MLLCVWRRRRALVAAVALTCLPSLAAATSSSMNGDGNGDLLARCEALGATTAVLTVPTDAELPSDVAAALETFNGSGSTELTWSELDDVTKVGLLWAYGYVFTGGSSSADTTGDSVVQVYTRCGEESARGDAVGARMTDVAVTYSSISGVSSACEAADCGTFYQATNTDCVATVSSTFQCAVSAASASIPSVNGASFWSSAASGSAIPYPQAFQHSLSVSANGTAETLELFAIHMRSSDRGSGTSCPASTGDSIIPCLRLADVDASASSSGSKGFCRPTVDVTAVQAFLQSKSTVDVSKEAATTADTSSSSNTTVLAVAIGGGGVLLLLAVMLVCCCCRKRRQRDVDATASTTAQSTQAVGRSESSRAPLFAHGRKGGWAHKASSESNSDGSSNATNVNPSRQGPSRRSWYTNFGGNGNNHNTEASNRDSTLFGSAVPGRRSSMAGSWVSAAGGGKSVNEFCNESEALTAFMQDPQVFTKRIAFDELTFLRMLSKGAYGEVWLGQLETRHVAIKRLLPEKCQFTASLEQFAGEIRLMCTLQHRNIVSFVGVSWNRLQNLCAVVEYMEAGDLDEVMKKNREKLAWFREKIAIAMDIAEGLVYLHCLRPVVVHRDLKSKNVLLNRKLHAKLSDFGVSRKTMVNETMTSGVGTLLWTAPEIIEGKKYSEKADIYSLGVVLSEIDTCEPPFAHVTSDKGERLPGMQLAQLVRTNKIRVSLRPDCPPSVRQLAMDCTQLDPDTRPNSMQVAFTLKSIIAPTLRLTSSTATTASGSSSSSTFPSSGHSAGGHHTPMASQALQTPGSRPTSGARR